MPSLFCLSETRFSLDRIEEIPGYNSFHTIRNRVYPSGGISLYVENNFSASKIDDLSFANDTIEICSIQITIDCKTFIILGVYRPHSDSIDNFNSVFSEVLSNPILRNRNCIIMGDFNICLLKDNYSTSDFSNLLFSYHFAPCIDIPTRFSPIENEQPSLLDHIWINKIDLIETGVLKIDITDHLPTFLNLKSIDNVHFDKIEIKFRDFSDVNKIHFQNLLAQTDWNIIKSENSDIFAENFIIKLNELFCSAFPLKIKFVSHRNYCNPWVTESIKQLIHSKENYFQLYRLKLISVQENNRFRNRVNNILRNCKNSYYSDLFSRCRNNLKQTWKNINIILSRKQSCHEIKKIICSNSIYSDNEQIASIFNEYFCNIGNVYADNIPLSTMNPCHYVRVNQPYSFFLEPVSPEEVVYYIKDLKNSKQNLNSISIQIMKENCEIIAPIVTDLINICFQTGNYPKILKKAVVLPLLKKGDPVILSNYRPISILPTLSKIIEKCLKSRLLRYFEINNLFNNTQFGFQKNVSTQDAILHLTEQVYINLNNYLSTLAVYVDFSKCFDTLNREILLKKLELYGIRGIPLGLFSSYLSDRYQAVKVNGVMSGFRSIDTGVPQGSVLGPILYLIYVNELPNISNVFSTCLFADDTTLIFKSSNIYELSNACQIGLECFFRWCCANRLSINISKTNMMLFSNIHSPSDMTDIYMNNLKIEFASSIRFLGVLIDDKLKFVEHIDNILQKISKNIGILYRLRQFMPVHGLIMIYRSLVECYLNYCILIYGNTYQSHINRIEVAQRKCLRVISNLPPYAHSNPIFSNLHILKFNDIYRYNLGIYMYKHIDQFDSNLYNPPYSTRSGIHHEPSYQRLTVTQNQSIHYQVPSNWLRIPQTIKDQASLNSFKHRYKSFLISNYSE